MSRPIQQSAASPIAAPEDAAIPLCVDLDGTLIRSDVLWESLLQLVRRRPLSLLRLPLWLRQGRAALKAALARRVTIDASALPYNEELLDRLKQARAAGRPIWLATASHLIPAQGVASHLGLFDRVLATHEGVNLKGKRKREALVEACGESGFDYAGDSTADLHVWPSARTAIVVEPSKALQRALEHERIELIAAPPSSRLRAFIRAIRVHQWVKNLLVFVPVLLAHRYDEPATILQATIAFFAFSCGASTAYVLNDLLDIEADRHHPTKRLRPFASGSLPIQAGVVMIPLLATISLGLASLLPGSFIWMLLFYISITTAYSMLLKKIAILDIVILAGLFTTRLLAGGLATSVPVSEWLLAFSMFIFLSLAAIKRYVEVRGLESQPDETRVKGRGYIGGDAPLILQMGLTSGFMAVLVLALFISSESVTQLYHRPKILWLVCPLMLYWVGRVWLLARRGHVEEEPLSFAAKDWMTWLVALCGAVILLVGRGG